MKIPDGATQQAVDLSAYPSGVYFLRLQHKTDIEMIRVVKK
jgi:hypothetical protein